MSDFELRAEFEAISLEEVIPVFEADGEGEDAREYLAGLRDRHLHPFLEHRLADISKDHAQKKRRSVFESLYELGADPRGVSRLSGTN